MTKRLKRGLSVLLVCCMLLMLLPGHALAATNAEEVVSAKTRAASLANPAGAFWTWGGNHIGQLGDDTTIERHTPVLVGPFLIAIPPPFAIELDPADSRDFGTVAQDYPEQIPHSVTVRNVGFQPIGNLSVSLTGSNAGSFRLSTTPIPGLGPNATTSFTVVPDTGLSPGVHTATVEVSGIGGIVSESFDVRFAVIDPGIIQLNFDGVFEFAPRPVGDIAGAIIVAPRNVSNISPGFLVVRLTGENASSFEFTHISCPVYGVDGVFRRLQTPVSLFVRSNLEPGEFAEAILRPRPDLSAGTHTATVEVHGGFGISETFDVVIEVQ